MSHVSHTYAARLEREQRTHELTEQGWTPEQIATELGCSLTSVLRYRAALGLTRPQRTDDQPVSRELDQDREWTVDALCAQVDSDTFFPDKGGSTREAKSVCASCPVAAECLQYALRNDERFGVWGGLSERERRRLRSAT